MHKRKLHLLVWVYVLLVSCQSESTVRIVSSDTPAVPASTRTPTTAPTNTSTVVPTITPTEILPSGQLELIYQLGHGIINNFSVSPKGDVLVVASTIGVWIYQLPDGELLDYQEGNPIISIPYSNVTDIVWSPDGNNLAVSNAMLGVWIWNTQNWELLTNKYDVETRESTKGFPRFTWSPDSTKLALDTGKTNSLWIWDRRENQWAEIKTKIRDEDLQLDSPYSHQGILWNEDDGLQILVWNKLFSTETGKQIRTINTYIDGIGRVVWSPTKTHIYFLFDLGGGLIDNRTDEHLVGCCNNFSWSNDGHYLVMASSWGEEDALYVVDLQTNELEPEILVDNISGPVGWSHNNDVLLTARKDGNLELWNVTTNKKFFALDKHSAYRLFPKDDTFEIVSLIAYQENSLVLNIIDLFSGSIVGKHQISNEDFYSSLTKRNKFSFEVKEETNQIEFSLPSQKSQVYLLPFSPSIFPKGNSSGKNLDITNIAISPDGNILAAGNQGGDIIFWNIKDKSILGVFSAHIGSISNLFWDTETGNLISDSIDGTIKVWRFSIE